MQGNSIYVSEYIYKSFDCPLIIVGRDMGEELADKLGELPTELYFLLFALNRCHKMLRLSVVYLKLSALYHK